MGTKRQGDCHGDGSEAQRHGQEDKVALCLNRSRLYLMRCLSAQWLLGLTTELPSEPKQN